MKFSILMPTYNDADTIVETLDSLRLQTYENWELIIVDDGSSDHTREVVASYIQKYGLDHKIFYHYQENQDQLNAICHGSEYITGEYVYILHSDDLLYDEAVLEAWHRLIQQHPEAQGFFGDYQVIDGEGNEKERYHMKPYHPSDKIFGEQLLWLGRNLYHDFALHSKESFFTGFKENYLLWNTPFWLNLQGTAPYMAQYIHVKEPFFRYRVYEQNYIHNEIGKLNVLNGELRTAQWLMHFITIPCYSVQYFFYRCAHRLSLPYPVLYRRRETRKKSTVVKFIIQKRFPDYQGYMNLRALVSFYEHKNQRVLRLCDWELPKQIYYGKDMRMFHKDMLNNRLPTFYLAFMKEMELGFQVVQVTKSQKNEIEDILKFFGINYDVIIDLI